MEDHDSEEPGTGEASSKGPDSLQAGSGAEFWEIASPEISATSNHYTKLALGYAEK